MGLSSLLIVATSVLCGGSAFAAGVTYEEQAERLQNVNATFLDAVPFGDPIAAKAMSVEVRAPITILPEVNPRVGAKEEDVPTAPAHLIPIVQWSQQLLDVSNLSLGYAIHAGYLPAGGEKLMGLSASLTQMLYGAGLDVRYSAGPGKIYVPITFQSSSAEVTGAITEENSDDEFVADTTYLTFGVGYIFADYWGGVQFGSKSTTSKFDIEVDQTSLELDDTLSDADFGLTTQVLGGYQITEQFRMGASYLIVPDRMSTLRLLAGYNFEI